MKKSKVLAAFLSFALGMTSFMTVPVTAGAATDEATAAAGENGAASTVTSMPVTAISGVVTTAPPPEDAYDEPVECTVKLCINVRDYDTGNTIENVDVRVVKGYEGVEEECSFNTTDDPGYVHDFEYTVSSPSDKGVYQILLENIPEKYNYENNSTGWMLYLSEATAEKFSGNVYNYNLAIHPLNGKPAAGTVTGANSTGTTVSSQVTSTVPVTSGVVPSTETESSVSFEKERYDLPAGDKYILKLKNPNRVKMDYVVEDKGVACEKILYPTYVYVFTNNAGTTKVTAIGENGETAEAVINVYDPEPVYTATTTTGTGTVTTTETVTTYIRSTPSAGMSFDNEYNSLYIKPNDTKEFTFSAFAASEVEFKTGSPDLKIVDVEFSGGGLTPSSGKVTISCAYNAEPRAGVNVYSYTKNCLTGEYFKNEHSFMIVDDSFTPTTTRDPGQPTTTSTTTTTTLPKDYTTSTVYTQTTYDGDLEQFYTDGAFYDYAPKVEYDDSPMKIGETREIRFYHPVTKSAKRASIREISHIMSIDYEEGKDTFTVTALKEGKAQIYVRCDGCTFGTSVYIEVLSPTPAIGDTNCDGQVDMADAVLIMQALANPDRYGVKGTALNHLTEQGKINGDMNGDGLTVGDAQAIQNKLLGIGEEKSETKPELSDIVSIKSEYNPVMSDWSGLGILLEFNSPGYPVKLTANAGSFDDYYLNSDSGSVVVSGKTCDIKNGGYVLWSPDDECYQNDCNIEILVEGADGVQLGKIYIYETEMLGFAASLEKK